MGIKFDSVTLECEMDVSDKLSVRADDEDGVCFGVVNYRGDRMSVFATPENARLFADAVRRAAEQAEKANGD